MSSPYFSSFPLYFRSPLLCTDPRCYLSYVQRLLLSRGSSLLPFAKFTAKAAERTVEGVPQSAGPPSGTATS